VTDAIICNQCGAAVRTDVGQYFTVTRNSLFNNSMNDWRTRHFCTPKCLAENSQRLYEAVLQREGIVK
jgi:hypothetical protein